METEKIIEYINIDMMYEALCGILKEARDTMKDEQNEAFLRYKYDDEFIQAEAMEKACSINNQMREYLHSEHKMIGNFNNVDYDYPNFRGEGITYNRELVEDMIARLDANDQSEQTQKDREFLVDWFLIRSERSAYHIISVKGLRRIYMSISTTKIFGFLGA